MIKKLQENICVLFVLFLSIIWLGVLAIYVNNVYRSNLREVKEDVRYAIKDTQWKNFLNDKGASLDLDGF